jgi:UDP-N-acetylglucosamine 2-epimerase (non-hydrolysing)
VPCLTLRPSTERPITCEVGTNFIVGNDPGRIVAHARKILTGDVPRGRVPEKWDGRAADRIVEVLSRIDSGSIAGSASALPAECR